MNPIASVMLYINEKNGSVAIQAMGIHVVLGLFTPSEPLQVLAESEMKTKGWNIVAALLQNPRSVAVGDRHGLSAMSPQEANAFERMHKEISVCLYDSGMVTLTTLTKYKPLR